MSGQVVRLRFCGSVQMAPQPRERSAFAYGRSYDLVVQCERCPELLGLPSFRFCDTHRIAHGQALIAQFRACADAVWRQGV